MSASPHVTIDEHELKLLDAWWRASNYLSVGQVLIRCSYVFSLLLLFVDLSYGQPSPRATFETRAYQTQAVGPLGNHARTQLHLYSFKQNNQGLAIKPLLMN